MYEREWEKYGGEYLFEYLGIWGFGGIDYLLICLFGDLLKCLYVNGLMMGELKPFSELAASIIFKPIVAPPWRGDDRMKY